MTPEQLAELFIEDKCDILPNIMKDIEILFKQLNFAKEWRTDYVKHEH